MKCNKSDLRFGSQKNRIEMCTIRMKNIRAFRDAGWTWREVGKKYNVSRQAVHKFYTENLYLIEK